MQNRIITLILVVIIGILAGVGIVKRQAREPLLRELLKNQSMILQSQMRLDQKLRTSEGVSDGVTLPDPMLSVKLQNIENRLNVLEASLKRLESGQLAANVRNAPPAPPPEDLSTVHDIPVAHSPVRGNKNAPVTIVEFVDFQCAFCARFHPPLAETLEAYPQKVNYILKNFPLSFHQMARPAAKAAFAAGEQGKYWEMADALLENGSALSEEKIKEIAQEIGLNTQKFMDDYKNKDAQWEKYIQADMQLGQNVGVRGTPTFYINGKKTRARDFNSFKAEIDQILEGK